uniref:DUF2188 domain-containing protein n=1 Tax=Heterorhabditis bacteriophora TaxID=37862 RepID=A0A1I7XPB0_HETBA
MAESQQAAAAHSWQLVIYRCNKRAELFGQQTEVGDHEDMRTSMCEYNSIVANGRLTERFTSEEDAISRWRPDSGAEVPTRRRRPDAITLNE